VPPKSKQHCTLVYGTNTQQQDHLHRPGIHDVTLLKPLSSKSLMGSKCFDRESEPEEMKASEMWGTLYRSSIMRSKLCYESERILNS
jgi:hypothetical protein